MLSCRWDRHRSRPFLCLCQCPCHCLAVLLTMAMTVTMIMAMSMTRRRSTSTGTSNIRENLVIHMIMLFQKRNMAVGIKAGWNGSDAFLEIENQPEGRIPIEIVSMEPFAP